MRFTRSMSHRVLFAGVLVAMGILGWRASVGGEDQAIRTGCAQGHRAAIRRTGQICGYLRAAESPSDVFFRQYAA